MRPAEPAFIGAPSVRILAWASFFLALLAVEPVARVAVQVAWLYVLTGTRG